MFKFFSKYRVSILIGALALSLTGTAFVVLKAATSEQTSGVALPATTTNGTPKYNKACPTPHDPSPLCV